MITARIIEEKVLETLEIPQHIHRIIGRWVVPERKPVEFTQSFDIWTITSRAIASCRADFGRDVSDWPDLGDPRLATDTQRLHHQVKLDDNRLAYGRSTTFREGTDTPTLDLEGLFISQTAKRIDETYRWAAETMRDEDLTVRLLLAPEYQIKAFWFVGREPGSDKIVLLNFPLEFKKSFSRTESISTREFLRTLSEVQPIMGIRGLEDQP